MVSPDGGDENEPNARYGSPESTYPEMTEDGRESEPDSDCRLICCNEERPHGIDGKLVTLVVKPSTRNNYITVHDYSSGKFGFTVRISDHFNN